MNSTQKKQPINYIVNPISRFIQKETTGGIVLFVATIIALILANSPLSDAYHHFFHNTIGISINENSFLNLSLHHWINDGLMAVFFFVVGLELKREIVGGELSNPRKAIVPIAAALGGMIVPALIYFSLNPSGNELKGWGIPMATDIAFALGVLYLLGNRIPLSLKIFLTALAIVDDLGAVLVIAFFYTSEISFENLFIGLSFVLVMFIGNKAGIRNFLFYAIVGVFGVWLAFLLSGVHATIAAVLAAFTIPSDVVIKESLFTAKIEKLLHRFKSLDSKDEVPVLTNEQLHVLGEIKSSTDQAVPPLQRLEHGLHPFVSFAIMPIFALANAGISMDVDFDKLFENNIAIGVASGLLFGKIIGVVFFSMLVCGFKTSRLPEGISFKNLIGIGFLASIGFTMSMFISELAFTDHEHNLQAKVGIFVASIIGGIIGFFYLKISNKKVWN